MTYHEPTTLYLRCGHNRCLYTGRMHVQQTSPGIMASDSGPAELPSFIARCPKCRWEREVDDNFKPCEYCGVMDQPEMLMDIDGDMLCVQCRLDEWDRFAERHLVRLEVVK